MLRFLTHCLIATILIFALIAALNAIPYNLGFLDPIELAFKDFELTDIVFSKLDANKPVRLDTNIVVVNIGESGRAEIATLIESIEQYKPAVIGIDALFWKNDPGAASDSLVRVAHRYDNLVLSSRLEYSDTLAEEEDNIMDVRFAIAGYDLSRVRHGYINFSNDGNEFRTIRNWQPRSVFNTDTLESFSMAIIRHYARRNTIKLVWPKNDAMQAQTINYQRPKTYMRIDAAELMSPGFDASVLDNKIILMGFLGRTLSDTVNYEDSFYTPLNDRYAGRSLPDIHGIEIHANCISMVLHNDYVSEPAEFLIYSMSFLLCLFSIIVFGSIEEKLPYFYDLICKLIQIVEAVGLLALSLYIFQVARVKFDPTLAIAAVVLSSDIYAMYISAVEAVSKKFNNSRQLKGMKQ